MKNLKKIAVLSLVLLFTIFNSPSSSVGATLLSDSFGTGNTVNDVSGWRESENPNDNDSDVVAKQSSTSSSNSDYQSPDGGRFVKIKGDNDEWFCKQINAVGYQSLVLGYYWRGEASAESDDLGIVEFRANGTSDSSCNSNENGGWTTLASHQLDNASGENNQTQEAWALNSVNIPSDEDGMFLIRFRNDSSSDSEYFRVDGVKVEGTLIPIDLCPNIPDTQTVVPEGYKIIHANDQSQCVPELVDVQLCKTDDAQSPRPLSGWTVKLDGAGENDHQGVTGEDGCYVFNDIPYGNYTASEVMQEGWTQVSLPNENGTIQAYNLTNGPYYIVNHYNAPICDPQLNLIQNGGFEAPVLSPNSWSIIPDTDSLLKWFVAWVGTQTSGSLGLEIQNNVAGSPAEGSQHAELDGEHPVSIWQDVPTIPGKVYNLNFKYSARPGRDAADNKIEVKAGGVTLGATLSEDGTSLTNTSWGAQSRSFIATGTTTKVEFVDTGTDTSFGGYLDAVSLTCDPNPKATINAKKIVCDSEADLPNWGSGGADIDANTATNFLEQHPSCHLEPWTFEFAPDGTNNPGDNIEVAGGVWTAFTTTAQIPAGSLTWVREQMKPGYVPFSGATSDLDSDAAKNSAELYCNTDVLNYDNYDWINPVEPLKTYYCVGFNALAPVDMCPNIGGNQTTVPEGMQKDEQGNCVAKEQCVDTSMDIVSDTTNMVGEGNAFGPLTFVHSAWTAVINGAMWIWDGNGIADPTVDTTKVFTKNFTVTGVASDSSIEIASDNSYTVKINDTTICTDETEGNTDGNSFAGPDTCTIPASALVTGSNTLSITVRNWAVAESTPESNPAGLMYKLHVNAKDCPEAPTTGSIEIKKYLCPADFVPNRNDNGVGSNVPEGCSPQSGVAFSYVHGSQSDANGPYPELDMPLISGGSTSGGILTIPNLPSAGRYLVKETNSANLLGLYCEGDGDTNPSNNDNQELTFVPAGGVAHCVAYNKAQVVVEENPQCSDGSDNDEDGLTDYPADPGCSSSEDDDETNVVPTEPIDVCSNVDGMQESLPSNFHFAGEGICIPNGGSSGDNNSPGPGPSGTPSPDQGQVLGATTSCGLYLETFLKYGNKNNNEEQVKKLQTFLNDYLELDPKITVNGIFGLDTKKAVIKFQEKEFGLVLNPWKLKKGTGWVYKTTVTRINNIMCETLNIPLPEAKID